MSFEELDATAEQRESIIHLLTLSAFIDNMQIGEGLFSTYYEATAPNSPHWLTGFVTNGIWDKDKYQDCIVRLLSVNLIQSIDIMTADARFSFHPLIVEWLKLRTDDAARDQYIEEAIWVLRLFIDAGDKKEMPFRDKSEVLAHLATRTANEEAYHCQGNHVSNVLMNAMVSFGSFYRRLGRYEETRSLIERAMNPEPHHYITPSVRNVLANMYSDIWEHKKAEYLYYKVFEDLGKTPPARDSDERVGVSTLGFMYWTSDDKLSSDGKSLEASSSSAYQSHEPWTLAFLSTLNGLGLVHLKEGRLKEAEKLFTQALAGRVQAQGPDNINALNLVDHLGTVKLLEGDLDASGRMYSRALAGLEQHFGVGYLSTLQTINNFGLLRLQSNCFDKAEEMLLRAHEGLDGGQHATHISTLQVLHNIGILYHKQGKLDEAKLKLEQALEGWELNGIAKPEADSRYCLAEVHESLNNHKEAEGLFRQAAHLYEVTFGPGHPQTSMAVGRAKQVNSL